MPELPEVETVTKGLQSHIIGKKITSIATSGKRLRLPFPIEKAQKLEGQEILSIKRRARYIIIELSCDQSLLIHLGMSGKLIYQNHLPKESQKHDHITFSFNLESTPFKQ